MPSDFLISFVFSKWHPSIDQQNIQPDRTGKHRRNPDGGPGTYLTPNRILHPYWVPKKPGMSFWLLCHRDVLKHPKKLRVLYRYTQEPKFSPHLTDQISSQLARRIAQECEVLKRTLGSAPSSTQTVLDRWLEDSRSEITRARVSDYPILSSGAPLLQYLNSLISESSKSTPPDSPSRTGPFPDPSGLGAIMVMSPELFKRLLELDPARRDKSISDSLNNNSEGMSDEQTLMFSLSLSDGPIPIWDLETLLKLTAKKPPRKNSEERLITADTHQSTIIPPESNLVQILMKQITNALNYSPSNFQVIDNPHACLIPLTELTYPLILALRRATWWLGQGFEVEHFSHINVLAREANDRKIQRESDWLNWVRSRNVVEGKIKNDGELWIPVSNNKSQLQNRWRRV